MRSLLEELEANFRNFSTTWNNDLRRNTDALAQHSQDYLASYQQLVSLQAWRTTVLEQCIPPESLEFFLEAQNDALTSHIQASIGSWRTALKSLRSCIENALFTLYYMDHPVELTLWQTGKHKMGFAEIIKYLDHHPKLDGTASALSGREILKKEYETLSKAVHGSARSFRMTEDGKAVNLWSTEKRRLSQWRSRENSVLKGLNLLYLTFFREELKGAKQAHLRAVLGFCIPQSKDREIQQAYGVRIKRT